MSQFLSPTLELATPCAFSYPLIPGPDKSLLDRPCYAFEKFDGSRICFTWERHAGWHQLESNDPRLAPGSELLDEAEAMFETQFAEAIPELLYRHKEYRLLNTAVACCEFYGSQTFAGRHLAQDARRLKLFDIYLPGYDGFMPPLEFITYCSHLQIPRLVYQGPFNRQLIQDVYHNALGIGEGAVVKGLRPSSRQGKALHEVWMAKIKTRKWLLELRRRAEADQTYDYAGELLALSRLHPQPK